MFLVLWEFEVKPGSEQSFESALWPRWRTRLFRRHPGYLRTLLLQDPSRPRIYLTLDFWHSESALALLQTANREAYHALDRSTEPLTSRETRLGSYTQTDVNSPSA
jgi:heme-degrading monooxygenase HmoA